MSSSSSHMRKNRQFVKAASRPNSEINVTPLVDVVLVLLIIFMVVTPLLEKDINVQVPDTEQTDDQQEVPPDQLVVNVDKDGSISLNSEKMALDVYISRLKAILATKTGDKLVFFMADEKANYGKVIGALDGARLAGAQILGMMTEVPPGMGATGAPGAPTPPPAPGK